MSHEYLTIFPMSPVRDVSRLSTQAIAPFPVIDGVDATFVSIIWLMRKSVFFTVEILQDSIDGLEVSTMWSAPFTAGFLEGI